MISLLLKAAMLLTQFVSVYTLSFRDTNGHTVNMAAFEGKKILIVNIALNSRYASQLAELEQLHQQYQDSLVIIVSPSNDFGNEPNSNQQINKAITNTYNAHYIIAAKENITTTTTNALYQWLNNIEKNSRIQAAPHEDFYKFLLDREGKPIGIFKGSVSPLSDVVKEAIAR